MRFSAQQQQQWRQRKQQQRRGPATPAGHCQRRVPVLVGPRNAAAIAAGAAAAAASWCGRLERPRCACCRGVLMATAWAGKSVEVLLVWTQGPPTTQLGAWPVRKGWQGTLWTNPKQHSLHSCSPRALAARIPLWCGLSAGWPLAGRCLQRRQAASVGAAGRRWRHSAAVHAALEPGGSPRPGPPPRPALPAGFLGAC